MKHPKKIGILRLDPLPGSSGAALYDPFETTESAGAQALDEARALVRAGYDGVLLVNGGDAPRGRGRVRPETAGSFALIGGALREALPGVALGVSLLEIHGAGTVALAGVIGADFALVRKGSLAAALRKRAVFCPKLEVWVRVEARSAARALQWADAAVVQGGERPGFFLKGRCYRETKEALEKIEGTQEKAGPREASAREAAAL